MSVVTSRSVVMHRWDGSVFHVRIFNSEDEARRANDGPWHASKAMAKAIFEDRQRTATPAPSAPPSVDPLADLRAKSAALKADDRRRFLFAEAKRMGLKFFAGIKTEDLEAKITEALKEVA